MATLQYEGLKNRPVFKCSVTEIYIDQITSVVKMKNINIWIFIISFTRQRFGISKGGRFFSNVYSKREVYIKEWYLENITIILFLCLSWKVSVFLFLSR